MAFIALASASSVKLEKSESVDKESSRLFVTPNNIEESSRLYFTSNNFGSFLALNSTTLVTGVVVLILVAVVALLVLGDGSLGGQYSRNGNEYPHPHEQAYHGDETENQARYKRFAPNDIASKMAQLEQAFKKYQVEEAECELYIACEASQVQRIEENGPLARIVFDILSTFNRAKDGHKWDDRMEGLVKAFEFGTGASASGQVDPCQPLRNKCFELHAKY